MPKLVTNAAVGNYGGVQGIGRKRLTQPPMAALLLLFVISRSGKSMVPGQVDHCHRNNIRQSCKAGDETGEVEIYDGRCVQAHLAESHVAPMHSNPRYIRRASHTIGHRTDELAFYRKRRMRPSSAHRREVRYCCHGRKGIAISSTL